MRGMWNRLEADIREYRYAIGSLLLYYVAMRLVFHAFCPLVIITGLPCPGCGLSRSVWYFLTGQFSRSFSLHPLGAFWLLLLVWFCINRYVAGKQVTKGWTLALTTVCIATLLLYGYRMATLFPGRPPMSYTGHNLLERVIPGYRQRILTFFRLYG